MLWGTVLGKDLSITTSWVQSHCAEETAFTDKFAATHGQGVGNTCAQMQRQLDPPPLHNCFPMKLDQFLNS